METAASEAEGLQPREAIDQGMKEAPGGATRVKWLLARLIVTVGGGGRQGIGCVTALLLAVHEAVQACGRVHYRHLELEVKIEKSPSEGGEAKKACWCEP